MACLILSSKLPNDNSPPCTCNIGILFNRAAMAEDNASVRSPKITIKSGFSNPKIFPIFSNCLENLFKFHDLFDFYN